MRIIFIENSSIAIVMIRLLLIMTKGLLFLPAECWRQLKNFDGSQIWYIVRDGFHTYYRYILKKHTKTILFSPMRKWFFLFTTITSRIHLIPILKKELPCEVSRVRILNYWQSPMA